MITIKEEFVDCDKWRRAVDLGGSDAIVMWLALKRYTSANPTDGFIPDEEIDKLPGAPRRARKALEALVGCGKLARDGSRGAGLVEKAEHGWQLHDYEDHANSSTEEKLRREKARDKKRAQREAKRRELEQLRSRGQSRGTAGDSPGGQIAGQPPGHSGARPPAHVRERAPTPTQPNQQNPPPSVDLTGRGDVRPLTEDEEDQFFAESAGEKAMRILADDRQAELLQPHLWPEVRELIGLFAQSTGTEQRILPYEHDPGVRAVVLLLAKFELPRLRVGVPLAVATDFWRAKPGRPLSNLSDTVLANALAEDAELAKVEARRLANIKRFAVPRRPSPAPLPAAEAIELANDALKKVFGVAAGGSS
jgi:hypothetical protein